MEAKLGCGPPLLHAYLQFCYLLLPKKKKSNCCRRYLEKMNRSRGFVSYCFTNDCIHARWPKNKLSRASKSAIALCSNRNCPRLIWCCAPPLGPPLPVSFVVGLRFVVAFNFLLPFVVVSAAVRVVCATGSPAGPRSCARFLRRFVVASHLHVA